LSLNCRLIDYSQNHITVKIIDNEKGLWGLTGYYGYPNGAGDMLLGISFRPMGIDNFTFPAHGVQERRKEKSEITSNTS